MKHRTLDRILAESEEPSEPQIKHADLEDKLTDAVLNRIKHDVELLDFSAIAVLLSSVPVELQIEFLPEEQHAEFAPLKEEL